MSAKIEKEINRRRTFAIISHPDAGKTTLTEKLLLFGGAIREAGAVRARRAARHATSDWLELERQRGISVSSSVMTFEFEHFRVNILDTPGHHDFSEDTYRTLTAADSAVMLIDAAKGVEPQTRKLFKVCRERGIPIFTFVNKMDRLGQDPLELMSEIEDVLQLPAVPVQWPIGAGADFKGIYDRLGRCARFFSGGDHGTKAVDDEQVDGEPDSAEVQAALGDLAEEVCEGLELLDGAGETFDLGRVSRGEQTPMFFGSALTNYGILPFLERFLEWAPPPAPVMSDQGLIEPAKHPFSGFVFKIQANMDPDHRDRVAFVRVCSGQFKKGESTTHVPSGKKVRLANSTLLMAQDREAVEEAWPGDVVGLFDPGLFRIGDTLSHDGTFQFEGIPRFSPEHFSRVRIAEVLKRKSLEKGLDQLTQEGLVQLFKDPTSGTAAPILGAVGPLQFDVMKHRLASEYKVDLKLDALPYRVARWVTEGWNPDIAAGSTRVRAVEDRSGNPVLLFENVYTLEWFEGQYSSLKLAATIS